MTKTGWITHLLSLTSACLLTVSASAQSRDIARVVSRVELHSVPSLTLSDRQFLTGDASGKAVTISGEMRIAQGSGRLPLVILMHGSNGIGPNVQPWVEQFNSMGISTFLIDSFTGRGLSVIVNDPAEFGRLNMIVDVYHALEVASKHPRVDANRIAIMGFSLGGQATLYASMRRFQKMWNKSGIEPVGYLSLYPGCTMTLNGDTDVAAKPIRIFHGTDDDFDPIAACKAYVERLQLAKHDATLTEYANASHVFDTPLDPGKVVLRAKAVATKNCVIRELNDGVLLNTATQQPFTYQDSCVGRDAHSGNNEIAYQASHEAVAEFLNAAFSSKKP